MMMMMTIIMVVVEWKRRDFKWIAMRVLIGFKLILFSRSIVSWDNGQNGSRIWANWVIVNGFFYYNCEVHYCKMAHWESSIARKELSKASHVDNRNHYLSHRNRLNCLILNKIKTFPIKIVVKKEIQREGS